MSHAGIPHAALLQLYNSQQPTRRDFVDITISDGQRATAQNLVPPAVNLLGENPSSQVSQQRNTRGRLINIPVRDADFDIAVDPNISLGVVQGIRPNSSTPFQNFDSRSTAPNPARRNTSAHAQSDVNNHNNMADGSPAITLLD